MINYNHLIILEHNYIKGLNMSFPSLSNISPSRETIHAVANTVGGHMTAGYLFAWAVSLLQLTSQNINPLATGLAGGTYILVKEVSDRIIANHVPVSDNAKEIIGGCMIAVSATAAFGVYVATSTLSYKVSLIGCLVSSFGIATLRRATKPKPSAENGSEEIDSVKEKEQEEKEKTQKILSNMKNAGNALGAQNEMVVSDCKLF